MSVQSVNQHLRVYVSPATTAVQPAAPADDTILDLSIVTAGGLPLGGITFRSHQADGGFRDDNAPSTTLPFQVIYKDMAGTVFFGPVIKQDEVIKMDLLRDAVAPTQQVSNLTIGTATANESYVLRLTVPGYGGLLGAQDEVNFYGTFKAGATPTVTSIADGLVASLQTALSKAPVPIATVSNVAGAITVTGLAQPYEFTKWSGRQVNFALSLAAPAALAAGDDGDTTVPNPGNGNFNQVAGLEEFYAGYNTSWKNRYGDYPNEKAPTLVATAGKTYVSDTIVFAKKIESANGGSQRQVIQLFYQKA